MMDPQMIFINSSKIRTKKSMVHFFESTQEDACVHFGLTAVEMLSTVFSAGVKAEVSSM